MRFHLHGPVLICATSAILALPLLTLAQQQQPRTRIFTPKSTQPANTSSIEEGRTLVSPAGQAIPATTLPNLASTAQAREIRCRGASTLKAHDVSWAETAEDKQAGRKLLVVLFVPDKQAADRFAATLTPGMCAFVGQTWPTDAPPAVRFYVTPGAQEQQAHEALAKGYYSFKVGAAKDGFFSALSHGLWQADLSKNRETVPMVKAPEVIDRNTTTPAPTLAKCGRMLKEAMPSYYNPQSLGVAPLAREDLMRPIEKETYQVIEAIDNNLLSTYRQVTGALNDLQIRIEEIRCEQANLRLELSRVYDQTSYIIGWLQQHTPATSPAGPAIPPPAPPVPPTR